MKIRELRWVNLKSPDWRTKLQGCIEVLGHYTDDDNRIKPLLKKVRTVVSYTEGGVSIKFRQDLQRQLHDIARTLTGSGSTDTAPKLKSNQVAKGKGWRLHLVSIVCRGPYVTPRLITQLRDAGIKATSRDEEYIQIQDQYVISMTPAFMREYKQRKSHTGYSYDAALDILQQRQQKGSNLAFASERGAAFEGEMHYWVAPEHLVPLLRCDDWSVL